MSGPSIAVSKPGQNEEENEVNKGNAGEKPEKPVVKKVKFLLVFDISFMSPTWQFTLLAVGASIFFDGLFVGGRVDFSTESESGLVHDRV